MVVANDWERWAEVRDITDQVCPDEGMLADFTPFIFVQRTGFMEHFLANVDFTNVM